MIYPSGRKNVFIHSTTPHFAPFVHVFIPYMYDGESGSTYTSMYYTYFYIRDISVTKGSSNENYGDDSRPLFCYNHYGHDHDERIYFIHLYLIPVPNNSYKGNGYMITQGSSQPPHKNEKLSVKQMG